MLKNVCVCGCVRAIVCVISYVFARRNVCECACARGCECVRLCICVCAYAVVCARGCEYLQAHAVVCFVCVCMSVRGFVSVCLYV